MSNLDKWLSSYKYLPEILRDWHDQKNIFKSISHLYQDNENADKMPDWISSHSYVIDWFLWFMASRGYTLQKTRKKSVEFRDIPNMREIESDQLKSFLSTNTGEENATV